MFIGWIAYYTRPMSVREGLSSSLCVWLGLTIGAIAATALGVLSSKIGILGLPIIVFFVAMVVITMRKFSIVNNVTA